MSTLGNKFNDIAGLNAQISDARRKSSSYFPLDTAPLTNNLSACAKRHNGFQRTSGATRHEDLGPQGIDLMP